MGPRGDLIDVSQFFSNFAALSAHTHQIGNDVVISLDPRDQLVLVGVQTSALHAFDFHFA
jgi:hypothetical protein